MTLDVLGPTSYQTTTKDAVAADTERLTRELAELASELIDLHMVAQSIKHYWQCNPAAGIPCVRCQRDEAQRELGNIKRVIIAFHKQEGEGILAVKRIAKRLDEAARREAADELTREAQELGLYEETAGGTRLPAESPADYPAGYFSPAGTSYGGTEPEEAGP